MYVGTPSNVVPYGDFRHMLGWMMVFALMAILAAVTNLIAGPAAEPVSMKLATMIFGALFFVCVITSVARGRA
jgi:hypothetical protein